MKPLQSFPPYGPSALSRNLSAFLCVTRNGLLRLIFQQPSSGGRYDEIYRELEIMSSTTGFITHAAFANDPGMPCD